MRVLALTSFAFAASLIAIAACSGTSNQSGFSSGSSGSGSGGSGGGSGGSGGGSGGTASSGGSGGGFGSSGGSSGGTTPTGDGGGCNPNPANYDIPGNGCDDDGDGQVDNVTVCDSSLSASSTNALDFAKAIGLCQQADSTHWGVVSAVYTAGYSQSGPPNPVNNFHEQHGFLPAFGNTIKYREGNVFGVLSSGSATAFDSDYIAGGGGGGKGGGSGSTANAFKGFKNGMQGESASLIPPPGSTDTPPGFPNPNDTCMPDNAVNDLIDVKMQIKVPANAKGFSFDFDFWTGEYPEYACSSYNDAFFAVLKSQAFNNNAAGNISFDSKGNTITVNSGFFTTCSPASATTGCDGTTAGTASCSAGANDLAGTGFDDPGSYCDNQQSSGGGATGWLTSQAPVQPGETITVDFLIWDTDDWNYDSSVLVDNWLWVPSPVPAAPVTTPSPPK